MSGAIGDEMRKAGKGKAGEDEERRGGLGDGDGMGRMLCVYLYYGRENEDEKKGREKGGMELLEIGQYPVLRATSIGQ